MPSIVQGVALDSNGNALASPSVTVYTAGTTTAVSIYSDRAGATAKANPFTGDAAGRWAFYVATGRYDLVFVAGTNTYTLEDVEVQDLLTHASRHYTGAADPIDPDQLTITTALSQIVAASSGLKTAIQALESYLVDPDGDHFWWKENIEAALKDLYELAEEGVGASAAATSFPWDPRLHWESSFLDQLRNVESSLFHVAEQAFLLPDHGGFSGLGDDDHTQYILAAGTRNFSGEQSMGTNKLVAVTDPTADQDAATKKYVDDNILAIHSGAFTRDTTLASGTQSITAPGWTPRLVILIVGEAAGPEASWGFDDGSTNRCIFDYHTAVADAHQQSDTRSIIMQDSGGSYTGTLTMTADGFDVNWLKVTSPTGTAYVKYIAFR